MCHLQIVLYDRFPVGDILECRMSVLQSRDGIFPEVMGPPCQPGGREILGYGQAMNNEV